MARAPIKKPPKGTKQQRPRCIHRIIVSHAHMKPSIHHQDPCSLLSCIEPRSTEGLGMTTLGLRSTDRGPCCGGIAPIDCKESGGCFIVLDDALIALGDVSIAPSGASSALVLRERRASRVFLCLKGLLECSRSNLSCFVLFH